MDPTAAKYIGAGIACIGMGGAGVGVGIIFGNYLAAALRNPSAAQGQFGNLIFGFAITEALGHLLAVDRAVVAVRAITRQDQRTSQAQAKHNGRNHRSYRSSRGTHQVPAV
jgi:F-type H+-transporting ATPase subunit c